MRTCCLLPLSRGSCDARQWCTHCIFVVNATPSRRCLRSRCPTPEDPPPGGPQHRVGRTAHALIDAAAAAAYQPSHPPHHRHVSDALGGTPADASARASAHLAFLAARLLRATQGTEADRWALGNSLYLGEGSDMLHLHILIPCFTNGADY